MKSAHKEIDFEKLIEAHLVDHGWIKGKATDYDVESALVPNELFAFIQDTQPELWSELEKHHKSELKSALLAELQKWLQSHGTIRVVRSGFKFYGKQIDLCYFKPAFSFNEETLAKYKKNRLVVTRQIKFIDEQDDSFDMLLSVNGIPIATVELKNQLTGQNVDNAIKQYKNRDPKHLIFQFNARGRSPRGLPRGGMPPLPGGA